MRPYFKRLRRMLPDDAAPVPLAPDCMRCCFFDCAKRAFGGGCCGFGRFGICTFFGVLSIDKRFCG